MGVRVGSYDGTWTDAGSLYWSPDAERGGGGAVGVMVGLRSYNCMYMDQYSFTILVTRR